MAYWVMFLLFVAVREHRRVESGIIVVAFERPYVIRMVSVAHEINRKGVLKSASRAERIEGCYNHRVGTSTTVEVDLP